MLRGVYTSPRTSPIALRRADFHRVFYCWPALNGFRATHYFDCGVQNHSLPTKFWNKNQNPVKTFPVSAGQNVLTCIAQNVPSV
jgi:hypothetical protein